MSPPPFLSKLAALLEMEAFWLSFRTLGAGAGIAAAGAGLGMGMAAGGVFGNMAQQMFAPMQPQTPPPNAPQHSGRFAQKSAEPETSGDIKSGVNDPVATLKKLKEMLDLGLIEQTEYDSKKTEIMSRM